MKYPDQVKDEIEPKPKPLKLKKLELKCEMELMVNEFEKENDCQLRGNIRENAKGQTVIDLEVIL